MNALGEAGLFVALVALIGLFVMYLLERKSRISWKARADLWYGRFVQPCDTCGIPRFRHETEKLHKHPFREPPQFGDKT